ncbi:AAA family ATPase [candidate division WWE3 bacterium CG_4_10_14_0_2_um_filter_41_14]|uniref:AAA family ATPase n=1 Tax=candidate division WWE3 bacterium CG_4_10_14_0_2_um_filter_41_14 TaxID=1975072 RepID=A0A2M7TJ32_UNCKA|nr:MAG: AAA family ATPase [candidate division WWE3 bacterium CG_4_10_14_0_2_um_filter_41_14]
MHNPPLADRMRPTSLNDVVGQEHLIGSGKPLRILIESDSIPSMILWGSPGTGKTTLARIIANETKSHFVSLSATDSGVKDIKQIADDAKKRVQSVSSLFSNNEPNAPAPRTILFIDEIHRFNKSQQDRLLPLVENGTITLIGATTENPSFEIISPLLSRSRVFVLKSLETQHISHIIESTVKTINATTTPPIEIRKEATQLLSHIANGDARSALNILDVSIDLLHAQKPNDTEVLTITPELITNATQTKTLRYDKTGDEHFNIISAFIKSMRAGNADSAIYYSTRMLEAGEDPKFIARRMVVFASEDIGLANPTALVVANAVFEACTTVGYPECAINISHGVAYLSQCKKDRSAYDALQKAREDVATFGDLPIPFHLRNAPTKLMRDLDYGKGYNMYNPTESLLPKEIADHTYFTKKEPGNDKT